MGDVTVLRPACRTREVGARGTATVRRGQEEGRVGMGWKQSALINDSLLIREREENSIRFAAGSPKLQAREGMHLMRWDLEDSLPPPLSLPPQSGLLYRATDRRLGSRTGTASNYDNLILDIQDLVPSTCPSQ